MKRYRVLPFFDFDTRAMLLADPIPDEWDDSVKALHKLNRENTQKALKYEFGDDKSEMKLKNFVDLGSKPISVLAFHNEFFSQVRTAFVMGAYYPALTGACALGERILNHLLLGLRGEFTGRPEYRKIHGKKSFDNWTLAIDTLEAWSVLLPNSVQSFRELASKRNHAIHFQPDTDKNPRDLALEAVRCLQRIIGDQFCGFGSQPWFMTGVPGEAYISKEWQSKPFVGLVYLPNSVLVGPRHKLEFNLPKIHVVDPDHEIELQVCTDIDFAATRRAFLSDSA